MGCLKLTYDYQEQGEKTDTLNWRVWVNPESDFLGVVNQQNNGGGSGVLDAIQTGLDVVGVFDPFGVADGLNAAIYLANGEYGYAAISAAAMIPIIGDLGKVGKYGAKAAKFTADQQALIKLAKEAAQKGGVTLDEAKILKDWAKEYNLPFRGPEIHPNRNFNIPHIHIGPVNHLPIKQPK